MGKSMLKNDIFAHGFFYGSRRKENVDIWTLLVLAIGVSMDAFAVSICKGLAMKQIKFKHMLIVGLWFGGFQALMPLIG